jgi:hypothetical protein
MAGNKKQRTCPPASNPQNKRKQFFLVEAKESRQSGAMATEFESTMGEEVHPKKKGLLGRLRRGKKHAANEDTRDQTPSPNAKPEPRNLQTPVSEEADSPVPSEDNRVNKSYSDDKSGSQIKQVRFPVKDVMKNKVPIRNRIELLKPPTAREAAYGGPPRYDWIDIVSKPSL